MKKILAFLLSACLITVSMAACSGSNSNDEADVSSDASASSQESSDESSSGDESSFTTVEEGKLIMATNATFPPYEYYDGDAIVGIDAEIAQKIAEKLGLELVISDMEFDQGTDGASDFIFEKMKKAYKSAGYSISRLIFWNVNSRTGAIPLKENERGVALVSGFSVNVCNMVMSGEMDPYKCLVEAINAERYKPVEEAVWSVTGEPANLIGVR